jgi:hypothetical protein
MSQTVLEAVIEQMNQFDVGWQWFGLGGLIEALFQIFPSEQAG